MKIEYLKFLECPKCHSQSLRLDGLPINNRIREGEISCGTCGTIYPIKNYIPRFSISTPYADSFGPQWRTFAASQLDNAEIHESSDRFESEIGWQLNDLEGKTVIEFGSGAGRFVDVVSKRAVGLIVGLDATDAVDAAQESMGDRENVFFIQGDIFSSPIRARCFDFAYSIGVLHHTPDPEKAFKIMANVVKPMGNVAVSVYAYSNYQRPNRDSFNVITLELLWALNSWRCEVFRVITTRLPGPLFLAYCKFVVPILHVLNKIPGLRYFRYLLPSTCYRHLPMSYSMVDTHDTYATKIVHRYNGKDVFQWFSREGIIDIKLLNSRAGWVSATGVVGPAL